MSPAKCKRISCVLSEARRESSEMMRWGVSSWGMGMGGYNRTSTSLLVALGVRVLWRGWGVAKRVATAKGTAGVFIMGWGGACHAAGRFVARVAPPHAER